MWVLGARPLSVGCQLPCQGTLSPIIVVFGVLRISTPCPLFGGISVGGRSRRKKRRSSKSPKSDGGTRLTGEASEATCGIVCNYD